MKKASNRREINGIRQVIKNESAKTTSGCRKVSIVRRRRLLSLKHNWDEALTAIGNAIVIQLELSASSSRYRNRFFHNSDIAKKKTVFRCGVA